MLERAAGICGCRLRFASCRSTARCPKSFLLPRPPLEFDHTSVRGSDRCSGVAMRGPASMLRPERPRQRSCSDSIHASQTVARRWFVLAHRGAESEPLARAAHPSLGFGDFSSFPADHGASHLSSRRNRAESISLQANARGVCGILRGLKLAEPNSSFIQEIAIYETHGLSSHPCLHSSFVGTKCQSNGSQ